MSLFQIYKLYLIHQKERAGLWPALSCILNLFNMEKFTFPWEWVPAPSRSVFSG